LPPVHCRAPGCAEHARKGPDGSTCPTSTPPELIVTETLTLVIAFGVACLAAYQVGIWFSAIGLPKITGYLAVGALIGTFGIDLIPTSAATDLRFIDELSLGVIAFVAGSELYLPQIRSRLRTISFMSGGIIVSGLILLGTAVFVLSGMVDLGRSFSTEERLTVAILGAVVLLALSPPSTIAVIKEVRARGPFTSTILSVTVVMDVVVIILFAVASGLAVAVLTDAGLNLASLGVIALDIAIAIALGFIVGKGLGWALSQAWPRLVKIAIILLLGIGIFSAAAAIDAWTAENFAFEIYIEPLLLAMVAGFVVTNTTPQRDQFESLLHDIGPIVYVAFFTLTGLSLKLDVLLQLLPFAVALFVVRIIAIGIGASSGAAAARADRVLVTTGWTALLTQAGIALGLAREAAVQFPELGASFSTLIISVVVLNEIFGPLALKASLNRAGEVDGGADEQRSAVVFGIEASSLNLARQLVASGWQVTMADRDEEQVERAEGEGLDAVHLEDLDPERLDEIVTGATDAVVAVSGSDADDVIVCTHAVEAHGVPRAVIRLDDLTLAPAMRELGVLVVDHSSAMVNLLEQAVRAPQSLGLMLHSDPNWETVQITVTNRDVVGTEIRTLRLPPDVLVVAIVRGDETIVPNGFTKLKRFDEMSLVGSPQSLAEATMQIGF
jgi:Trk K+ transport system NAD-binding subunit/Kef-type K+ transport system membrane component KefB